MDKANNIKKKLENFIFKYSLNRLAIGIVTFSLLLFFLLLSVLFVEYFLWLGTFGRTVLFFVFIILLVFIGIKFILFPILAMFRIKGGIDNLEASKLIGRFFPEIEDKLTNYIQLESSEDTSELVQASLLQKSSFLESFSFDKAISWSNVIARGKYLLVPVLFIILFWLYGLLPDLGSSYKRVVQFSKHFEQPLGYGFEYNRFFQIEEFTDLKFSTLLTGEVKPKNVFLVKGNERFLMREESDGVYSYTFRNISKSFDFRITTGKYVSDYIKVESIGLPRILEFDVKANFPNYTGLSSKSFNNTGNITVPEGSIINWNFVADNVSNLLFVEDSTEVNLVLKNKKYSHKKNVRNSFDYALASKIVNDKKNFFNFKVDVIKDEYPGISLEHEVDSIDFGSHHFLGSFNDDYKVEKLQLVYYKKKDSIKKEINISIEKSNQGQFLYDFPGDISLSDGEDYTFYFEVFDNDGVNGSKSSKSRNFHYQKLTNLEETNLILDKEKEAVDNLEKQISNLKKNNKKLEKIAKENIEKSDKNFSMEQQIQDFISKQRNQQDMLKKFSDEIKNNVDDKELEQKIEMNEEELKKKEKLLEELKKLSDKISSEKLSKKLEEVAKSSKQQDRSLEQILELTKQYYVKKKAEKMMEDLNRLADEQDPNKNSIDKDTQERINKDVDKLKEDFEELKNENDDLKKPMKMPLEDLDMEDLDKLAKDAMEKTESASANEAKKSQKKASKQMKKMAQSMMSSMSSSGEADESETIESLRQIMDNVITYSMSQEKLMEGFKLINTDNSEYASKLRRQQVLKSNFQHIDDSLFLAALKTPKITEEINALVVDVHFNVDKSLELLAENELNAAIIKQNYALVSVNELGNILSDMLDNMQNAAMSMGSGSGKSGESFQLPDIIEQHQNMLSKMKEGKGEEDGKGKKPGEKGEKGEGENGEKGENGKEGENGDSDNGTGAGKKGKQNNLGEMNEEEAEELFRIIEEQNKLRDIIEKNIEDGNLKEDVLDEMKEVEDDLIQNGITEESIQKMENIKHQLMKLKVASREQGEDEKRKSKGSDLYQSYRKKYEERKKKKYFNLEDVLQRKPLPLQPKYQKRIKNYFLNTND